MAQIIRKAISTTKAPSAIGPYSQAIAVNRTLYVSGQVGLNPDTMKLADDLDGQTKQALTNLSEILSKAGSSMDRVVKTTVLLTDMKNYAAVNKAYETFFSKPYPARAAFQVAGLPKDALVEIEAIAIVGEVTDQ